MNEKQEELLLRTLKRMESLLEAIDWKLWNFYQKHIGNEDNNGFDKIVEDKRSAAATTPKAAAKPAVATEDDEADQLAQLIDSPKKTAVNESTNTSVGKKSNYPSVENWN